MPSASRRAVTRPPPYRPFSPPLRFVARAWPLHARGGFLTCPESRRPILLHTFLPTLVPDAEMGVSFRLDCRCSPPTSAPELMLLSLLKKLERATFSSNIYPVTDMRRAIQGGQHIGYQHGYHCSYIDLLATTTSGIDQQRQLIATAPGYGRRN
jgi:hypothetical protein